MALDLSTRKPQKPVQGPVARRSPRISLTQQLQYGEGRGKVSQQGVLLNISDGGALLLCFTPAKVGTPVIVEVGFPIFPVPRLVAARIQHTKPAADDLMVVLEQKGKIPPKKRGGFLVGVEFTSMDHEDYKTLRTYIKEQIPQERRRRRGAGFYDAAPLESRALEQRSIALRQHNDAQPTAAVEKPIYGLTARSRKIHLRRRHIPAVLYACGLLAGAWTLAAGIITRQDYLTTLVRTAVALGAFWLFGRVSILVWQILEQWHEEEAAIVATTDGIAGVDPQVGDADDRLEDDSSSQAQSPGQLLTTPSSTPTDTPPASGGALVPVAVA